MYTNKKDKRQMNNKQEAGQPLFQSHQQAYETHDSCILT